MLATRRITAHIALTCATAPSCAMSNDRSRLLLVGLRDLRTRRRGTLARSPA